MSEREQATTVLLIRHGETAWNASGRWQGHTDVPLNEVGRRQARLLAQRLSSWPVSALYCSDLQRAAETAQIVGEALDLEPVVDPAWRERHAGRCEGLTREEVDARFPGLWARIRTDSGGPPGGEVTADLYERIIAAFEAVVDAHPNEVVAVVSHGGALRMVIRYILGVDREPAVSVSGNTGISMVTFQSGRPVLAGLNDVCHLNGAGGRT